MAMKKRAVPQKKTPGSDAVIYKIMIVLGVLCILLLALQLVRRYYSMIDYLFAIRTALAWSAAVFGVFSVACLILRFRLRKSRRFWQYAGIPLFLLCLILALSCAFLYATWVSYVFVLYFFYIASAILYMIALLYQHEFFLLSLINTCAGCVFYALSRLYGQSGVFSLYTLLLNAALVAAAALGSGLVFAAAGRDGRLTLFGKERQLFSRGFSPIPMYISCVVWLICLVVSAFLGSVFAYYCIFAAAAFELAAAVYYTMKLA